MAEREGKTGLDGLFTLMKFRTRPRLLGPYGNFEMVADTEFYLFSRGGLVYRGWLLSDDMPPLDFDLEQAVRDCPGSVGRYSLRSDGKYQIDWTDGTRSPTTVELPDAASVKIGKEVFKLMSRKDRLEYERSKAT